MDDAVLGDEAATLLTALVAVWEGLATRKRCAFGVERGIKLCTVYHAGRPKWRLYGTWDTVEELDAHAMVSCRRHAPADSPYPPQFVLCEVTAKGQAYVRARRGPPSPLKRLWSLAGHR